MALSFGLTTDLNTLAFQALAFKYTAAATFTLWVYEYLLTIGSETSFVWPARFTPIKALFLANRYLPLFVTGANAYFIILNAAEHDNDCKYAIIIISVASFCGFVLAELVLVMRVYVIWQSRKTILIIVIAMLSVKTAVGGVLTVMYLLSANLSPLRLFRSGCELVFTRRTEWITLLAVFSFEIAILTLMIVAQRAHLRKSKSEMVHILVQDGIMYCLCIMLISLVNIFVVRLAPPIIAPFLVIMQGTLHNILCTRLLLRLRIAGARSRSRSRQQRQRGQATATATLTVTSTSAVSLASLSSNSLIPLVVSPNHKHKFERPGSRDRDRFSFQSSLASPVGVYHASPSPSMNSSPVSPRWTVEVEGGPRIPPPWRTTQLSTSFGSVESGALG